MGLYPVFAGQDTMQFPSPVDAREHGTDWTLVNRANSRTMREQKSRSWLSPTNFSQTLLPANSEQLDPLTREHGIQWLNVTVALGSEWPDSVFV